MAVFLRSFKNLTTKNNRYINKSNDNDDDLFIINNNNINNNNINNNMGGGNLLISLAKSIKSALLISKYYTYKVPWELLYIFLLPFEYFFN